MEKMKPESIIEFEKLYGIELNEAEDKAHIITDTKCSNVYLLSDDQEVIGLNICSNSLGSIPNMSGFPKLERLNLSNNGITEIKGLEELKQLTMLDLSS